MSGFLAAAVEPFGFDFMQQAFAIGLLVAAASAVLSCLLVLKGWSLMGDAVSHSVLPGIVLAWVAGLPLILGAFVAGLACATATGWLTDNSRLKEDTVMGIVFSGMFALGGVPVRQDRHRAAPGPRAVRKPAGACRGRTSAPPRCWSCRPSSPSSPSGAT